MPQITTSITVSDPLTHCKLNPLSISVVFLGGLPSSFTEQSIASPSTIIRRFPQLKICQQPLQISVSLPKKYGDYTAPVLHATVSELQESAHGGDALELAQGHRAMNSVEHTPSSVSFNQPLITFLPLGGSFNPTSQHSWENLWPKIGDWLLNIVVEPGSHEWCWGVEAFWMAFVAANPQFPDGDWPHWDYRISLDGNFIYNWIEGFGADASQRYQAGDHSTRLKIWAEFQSLFNTFCPSTVL